MSFDKVLRKMIQEEIRSLIGPLADAVGQLQQNSVVDQLRSLLGNGAKRGPGRPPKLTVPGSTATQRAKKRATRSSDRACAVIACTRPVRSKGYCAAHYQKMRMLQKTKRLPPDWKANAAAHTVKDLVLPRGRAGAVALAQARKK